MVSTLDWKSSEDPRDIVHIVVQALVEGKLVVLPAETAYHVFASGLKPEAVANLMRMVEAKQVCRPSIFLRAAAEVMDYCPDLSRVAARIVHRGWPGPLVLELPVVSEATHSDRVATEHGAVVERSLASCLRPEVRRALVLEGNYLPQRVAAHEAIRHAMRLLPGPLVAAPLCLADGRPICMGEQVLKHCGQEITAFVDDGATHYGGLSTSLRIAGNQCSVTSQGVLEGENLYRLGQFIVLLVCTGNTCRSPMAETLLRDKLKKRFPNQYAGNVEPAHVASAGLSAFPGGPASSEAVNVMKSRGLNLNAHQSRPVTERALRHADLVLTMTSSHRAAIIDRIPEMADKIHLLSGTNSDVSDPFGGSESVYSACAEQMDGYLDHWVSQFEESWFPHWAP
jgi:protein-tyrosine-phosphatase/tRNA A37 threonylcarbamoyladenosine synthetase subunit TsaC/SUA5/YrdC